MDSVPKENTAKKRPRPELAAVSLILGFAAQFYLYHEKNTSVGLLLFAIAGIIFIIAADAAEKAKNEEKTRAQKIPLKKEILLFCVILLTACFFRFYQIDTVPAGAHRDEAKAALDSLEISQGIRPVSANSKIPIYISGITDNPAFYNYVISVFYKFHPSGITTARIACAFLGVLAVASIYFLARAMLGVNAAVIAGFLLAISRWHFTFTRGVLHAGFMVFIVILAVYFCAKAYKHKKTAYFLAAGLCSGLVIYTFQAGKAFLPGLLACGLYVFIKDRDFYRQNKDNVITALMALAVTLIPIIVFMGTDTHTFSRRPAELFLFSPGRLAEFRLAGVSAVTAYFNSLAKALLMFNKTGSPYLVYNYNHFPMLDFITGMFFMLGLLYSCGMAAGGSKKHSVLLILFLTGLHGTALFVESPHATRAVMALPFAILFAAIAAERMYSDFMSRAPGPAVKLIMPLAVILLIAAAAENYKVYFELFKKDKLAWNAFSADSRLAGDYLKRLGPGWNAILDPKYAELYESYAFKLETAGLKNVNIERLDFEKHLVKGVLKPGNNVFLMSPLYIGSAYSLEKEFPGGFFDPVYETYNPLLLSFFAFKVTAGGTPAPALKTDFGLRAWYFSRSGGRENKISRADPLVAFFWEKNPPVPAPFSAAWNGSLEIESPGIYDLKVISSGFCELKVDGEVIFSGAAAGGDVTETRLNLNRGLHELSVKSMFMQVPARMELQYAGPDTNGLLQVVPYHRLRHR